MAREVVRRESRQRPGLRWIEAGAGNPVVLVPGAGEVCLDWATVLPTLAETHRMIAYDRRGLGASRRLGPITLQSQLDDLEAMMREVGPALLIGHSWGGLLAELVTLRRPRLVTGLVLVDPFHEGTTAAVPWRLRALSRLMLDGVVMLKLVGGFRRVATGMGRTLAEKCTQDPEAQTALVEAYLASYSSLGHVAAIRKENLLGEASAEHVRALRSSTFPPTLPMRLLTAGRGKPHPLHTRYNALAADTVARWSGGEHVVVSDSGHYIHHDRPDVVVATVQSLR